MCSVMRAIFCLVIVQLRARINVKLQIRVPRLSWLLNFGHKNKYAPTGISRRESKLSHSAVVRLQQSGDLVIYLAARKHEIHDDSIFEWLFVGIDENPPLECLRDFYTNLD